jgi:hypothetical protein
LETEHVSYGPTGVERRLERASRRGDAFFNDGLLVRGTRVPQQFEARDLIFGVLSFARHGSAEGPSMNLTVEAMPKKDQLTNHSMSGIIRKWPSRL